MCASPYVCALPLAVFQEQACTLPKDEACVDTASVGEVESGVGIYYDENCLSELAADGSVAGCVGESPSLSRLVPWNAFLLNEQGQNRSHCEACV